MIPTVSTTESYEFIPGMSGPIKLCLNYCFGGQKISLGYNVDPFLHSGVNELEETAARLERKCQRRNEIRDDIKRRKAFDQKVIIDLPQKTNVSF